jgi:hypothetical protein
MGKKKKAKKAVQAEAAVFVKNERNGHDEYVREFSDSFNIGSDHSRIAVTKNAVWLEVGQGDEVFLRGFNADDLGLLVDALIDAEVLHLALKAEERLSV